MSDRYASEQSLHVFLAELFRRMGTAASDGVVHDTVEQHVDLLREQISSVDETLMVSPRLSHDGSVSSANASPQDSPPLRTNIHSATTATPPARPS